jgi:nucleoside-triphosphatase
MKHTPTDLRKQEIRISRTTIIWISGRIVSGFKSTSGVTMMTGVRAMMSSQSSESVPTTGFKNLLLTGAPGCGKTTVLERVMEHLGDMRLGGFLTLELREHGQRIGFEALGLSGRRAILAHVRFRSPVSVGRYGVEPDRLVPLINEELARAPGTVDAYLIDEIGKMECHCPQFISAMRPILDGPVPLVATIALRGSGFIAEVKQRPDVRVVEVTQANREAIPGQIAAWVKERTAQENAPWGHLQRNQG